MPSEPRVIQVINNYRAALLQREEAQVNDMVNRWLRVERALEGHIGALALEIERRRAAGEMVKPWRFAELERYQSLLAQAQVEIGKYANWADALITDGQRQSGSDGAEQARAVLETIYRDADAVHAAFDILPVEVIESMAGLTSAGSPLRDLLQQAWPDAVDGMTQAMVNSVAKGVNPRQTAKAMANGMAEGLQRCLTIARTEQLRVYREATRQQYAQSGVVEGYKRVAAKSVRTCLACLFADGRTYPLTTPFEEHPNGRCAPVPVVIGMSEINWQTGREWFGGLKAAQQREMMGSKLHEAWASGRVDFDAIVKQHHDATWGDHLRPATLKELDL